MYSIRLGQVVLEFERALIRVPQKVGAPEGGADEWSEEWADRPQHIEVRQHRRHAVVVGLDGFGAQRGEHRVEMLEPPVHSLPAALAYLVAQAAASEGENELVRQTVDVAEFPCGQVLSLNWSALGYAPGGRQYCLLPHDLPAIGTGFLRLDWQGVTVRKA